MVYVTLVDQLDGGKGYTLRGSDILDKPWINHEQYDRALFFHPPGAIVLFWATHLVTADGGLAIAQVLCFCLFFWSTIALAREVIGPMRRVTVVAVALLAAFSPIMSHVAGRFWLDGPLLAFGTAAAAIFFAGWRRKSWLLVIVSGAVFGYATLVKVPAVLMLPGLAAVAWAIRPQRESPPWRYFAAFVGVTVAMQAPWEFIQWLVVGSPFPTWSGKPAASLVKSNPFIYYLTVLRSPWVYVQLLPRVLWTLTPALLLFAIHWSVSRLRRLGLALLVWMSSIVGVHVWLGQLGYSKLLRYVILVTPAAILLFAGMFGELVDRLSEHRDVWDRRAVTVTLVALAALGAGLEVLQGLVTTFYDNPRIDVIMPLSGLAGFSR
jgi:4-amino-4-deoxy-L-arabinose transferase-like glycosyltransferase